MATDLHCHTRMSDGTVSIDELVMLAKIKGIGTIAVTDHDTFAGAAHAEIFEDRQGVEVIPGIEISAYDNARGRKVHILGYGCESPDRLGGLCKHIGESRKRAANIMMQEVMRLYPIPAETILRRVQGCTNIYKQHVMYALIDAGYTTGMFSSAFHKLFSPRGSPAYCAIEYPDVHDVIRQIHGAGGVTVMAHPGQYNGHDLMLELADRGEIDGIEVWHPLHKEEDVPQYITLARPWGLLMTGGSDFRGMYTSYSCALGAFTAPDEQLGVLEKKSRKIKSGGWLAAGLKK